MKLELKPFQTRAKMELHNDLVLATNSYMATGVPQVISFTAPTGAGKTIVVSGLMEDVFCGDSMFPDDPNAIFIWLSDSPQLNEQSKMKIDLRADKIRLNQCIVIEDSSFDQEMLDDGHVYFLNTQKLSKTANLTKHGDSRTYTIWETLTNTAREKANRLYVIIDEAHRGMQGHDAAKATSIMQKFLKGSPEDGLDPMPVVIGMSATMDRFNTLVKGIASAQLKPCIITPEEVRESGLLKDRIVITYPDEGSANSEIAILQAAVDDYKDKCDRWAQYCTEQHHAQVNPIMVIQVQNGTNGLLTNTDLGECMTVIEDRLNYHFSIGEVVHTFGDTNSSVPVNGLDIVYVEPYRIDDDKNIKIVFFKENLSTGWDCPRAETMMSFRTAKDDTYIAQLLGRMIRTPLQRRIPDDEILNDVHLFLPHFDRETVKTIVNDLQGEEGGEIPADIESETLTNKAYSTLTVKPKHTAGTTHSGYKRNLSALKQAEGQTTLFTQREPVNWQNRNNTSIQEPEETTHEEYESAEEPVHAQSTHDANGQAGTAVAEKTENQHEEQHTGDKTHDTTEERGEREDDDLFDRQGVIDFINNLGLLSYDVRKTKVNDYLKSLYDMTHLLDQHGISIDGVNETDVVTDEIVEMIHDYIKYLKESGAYENLSQQVKEIELKIQIFDVVNGEPIDDTEYNLFTTTESDIDRQFRLADRRLGDNGINVAYGKKYAVKGDMVSYKIDVILFVTDTGCMDKLNMYAKDKFHAMDDKYRRIVAIKCRDQERDEYNKIVKYGDAVSKHAFRLQETIPLKENGDEYVDHLYVNDETGTVHIALNNWEKAVLNEDRGKDDFVCWIRNPQRSQKYGWALSIPYELDGETKQMFPDFLIVRKDTNVGYVVDILEPHGPQYADGLAKAQGMAKYARENPAIGRVQIARESEDAVGQKRFKRIDLSENDVNDAVRKAIRNDELAFIFEKYGTII